MNGRIQTMPNEFQEYINKKIWFDSTEKLDGQSSTYFIHKYKILGIIPKYEFGVCSRNLRFFILDYSTKIRHRKCFKIFIKKI